MPKKIYQLELKIYFGQSGSINVYITRRNNETREYLPERRYEPTKTSLARLQNVTSCWVNKQKAKLSLYGRLICIEPTE